MLQLIERVPCPPLGGRTRGHAPLVDTGHVRTRSLVKLPFWLVSMPFCVSRVPGHVRTRSPKCVSRPPDTLSQREDDMDRRQPCPDCGTPTSDGRRCRRCNLLAGKGTLSAPRKKELNYRRYRSRPRSPT